MLLDEQKIRRVVLRKSEVLLFTDWSTSPNQQLSGTTQLSQCNVKNRVSNNVNFALCKWEMLTDVDRNRKCSLCFLRFKAAINNSFFKTKPFFEWKQNVYLYLVVNIS